MNVFFTADPHYGHAAIIELCKRPYASVEEMDEDLIYRHNRQVGRRDTVYFLGDVTFKHPKRYLDRLNGKKHLIIGNHDDTRANAKACYESVHEANMIRVNGQKIWCSHYAHLVWPKAHKGVWHCFGHSHHNLQPALYRGKMLDVGVDGKGYDYTPLSFDDVARLMAEKPDYTPVDQHVSIL